MIKNNDKPTEFELQAVLYNNIKNIWIEVRWEFTDYSIWERFNYKKWFQTCRFDILIFKDWISCAIIEVKRPWRKVKEYWRQYIKYKSYGMPLIYCNSFEDIEPTIDKIKNIIS